MEYFDIVDENNNPTSQKALRSEAHSAGLWHRAVHIYLFRKVEKELEFLVHLRAKTKDLNPNKWDTRFGGHLKSSEGVDTTVVNELKEEIGLDVDRSSLLDIGVLRRDNYPNREFTYTFCFGFSGEVSDLQFQDGEVQDAKWMKSPEIVKSMTNEPIIWSGSISEFSGLLTLLSRKLKK